MEPRYDHTSQASANVPIFRLLGQVGSFHIANNIQKNQISLPSQVLDELIEQLNGYKEFLEKNTEPNIDIEYNGDTDGQVQ